MHPDCVPHPLSALLGCHAPMYVAPRAAIASGKRALCAQGMAQRIARPARRTPPFKYAVSLPFPPSPAIVRRPPKIAQCKKPRLKEVCSLRWGPFFSLGRLLIGACPWFYQSAQYMPPMSGAAGAGASLTGMSQTRLSVVSSVAATEAAFCSALRETLVGLMMPRSLISQYSSLKAS